MNALLVALAAIGLVGAAEAARCEDAREAARAYDRATMQVNAAYCVMDINPTDEQKAIVRYYCAKAACLEVIGDKDVCRRLAEQIKDATQ